MYLKGVKGGVSEINCQVCFSATTPEPLCIEDGKVLLLHEVHKIAELNASDRCHRLSLAIAANSDTLCSLGSAMHHPLRRKKVRHRIVLPSLENDKNACSNRKKKHQRNRMSQPYCSGQYFVLGYIYEWNTAWPELMNSLIGWWV